MSHTVVNISNVKKKMRICINVTVYHESRVYHKICQQFQYQSYNEISYTLYNQYILVPNKVLYKLCIIDTNLIKTWILNLLKPYKYYNISKLLNKNNQTLYVLTEHCHLGGCEKNTHAHVHAYLSLSLSFVIRA